jgi:hypothetical protein
MSASFDQLARMNRVAIFVAQTNGTLNIYYYVVPIVIRQNDGPKRAEIRFGPGGR